MEKSYLDEILSLISEGRRVLDIGCGTGKPIAEYLNSKGLSVTGVDGSKNMLEKARAMQPQLRWILKDMRSLELNEKFEAIIAWDSLFHLTKEEQRQMFPIFTKHLETEGLLLFTSGPGDGEAIGDMNGNPLYHSSLSKEEYTKLLTSHHFEVLKHEIEDPHCGGHTVWLARKIR